MSKKQKIKELENKIIHHKKAYYNDDAEISDADFDVLVDDLQVLDAKSEVLALVGAPVEDNGWKKAKHDIPMGSLNKVATEDDMKAWVAKNIESEVFLIEKIDGLGIEALYEDGKLISAITRGNGIYGDNIYDNFVKMGGVKTTLPLLFTGSLRGEIIMTKENHTHHYADKANVRNTAAGVSRRLDGEGSEHLSILFYQAIGNVDLATEVEQLDYLKKDLKLDVPNWYFFSSDIIENIQKVYLDYETKTRKELAWEIDGLVIKVNNLQAQEELGETDNKPKGAIAYKFAHDMGETALRSVVWQLGNSGRLTPVASFDPIHLAGAQVRNASIHNARRIRELDIAIGDRIVVSRRNDIIPFVEKVIEKPKNRVEIEYPKQCPCCNGPVDMQGENIVCLSTDTCPGQKAGKIYNWINTIGVLEWGDKIIARLIDSGKVSEISDLYALTIDDLKNIDRMGDKSALKCYNLLWSHKEIPLEIFLGGLSIPMAAVSTIKLLMDAGYDTLDKIFNLSEGQLLDIKGIGPAKAKFLLDGLNRNKKVIRDIIKSGINIKEKAMGNLSGMSIAITGSTIHKRSELQSMIAENGGAYKSSVGKGCSHLVIADTNSTSIKAASARGLGIKLIGEEELIEMIGIK
jgi:DNA ligase (NAD+)